jgi:hypothetical protein
VRRSGTLRRGFLTIPRVPVPLQAFAPLKRFSLARLRGGNSTTAPEVLSIKEADQKLSGQAV